MDASTSSRLDEATFCFRKANDDAAAARAQRSVGTGRSAASRSRRRSSWWRAEYSMDTKKNNCATRSHPCSAVAGTRRGKECGDEDRRSSCVVRVVELHAVLELRGVRRLVVDVDERALHLRQLLDLDLQRLADIVRLLFVRSFVRGMGRGGRVRASAPAPAAPPPASVRPRTCSGVSGGRMMSTSTKSCIPKVYARTVSTWRIRGWKWQQR